MLGILGEFNWPKPEIKNLVSVSTPWVFFNNHLFLFGEKVADLISVLNSLVDKGNTVIVIEHNLDVIKCSDWIIDLGPEGGESGGQIIATGPPEELIKNKHSYTGQFLKQQLK